jgi:hypothetical protein
MCALPAAVIPTLSRVLPQILQILYSRFQLSFSGNQRIATRGEKTDLGRARKPPLSPSGWCEIDPRRVPLSCRSFSSRNRFQMTLTDQPEIQNKNPAAISVDFSRTIFAHWPNK